MADPIVYDWPATLVPSAQLFHAPGQVFEGGFTSKGAELVSPEPGGRAYLEMNFNTLKTDRDARLASWLFSKLATGAIFRIPLYRSPQLVPDADLSPLTDDVPEIGLPWHDDNAVDLLWDGDIGWGSEVGSPVTIGALEGGVTFSVDMSSLGNVLLPGHVIGYNNRAYMVDAIEYDDAGVATITVNPPLRTDAEAGEMITFRPYMIVRVRDPAGFRSLFDRKLVTPGALMLSEVLL
jgi:hypothetical protein